MSDSKIEAPLISVITISFNSEATIAATLRSVAEQTYPFVEHICVDGGSTDATVGIIESSKHVSHWLSQPDKGIYDAMNKGLALATGDVVGFLNSDDYLSSDSVLARMASEFLSPEVDAIYGDLAFFTHEDPTRVARRWKAGAYKTKAFYRGWHPPHPTFYVRRKVCQELGGFDSSMRISADYEFMLRFFETEKRKSKYIEDTLVRMRLGGASTSGLISVIRGNLECYRAFRKNGLRPSVWTIPMKLLRKALQLRSVN